MTEKNVASAVAYYKAMADKDFEVNVLFRRLAMPAVKAALS